MAFLDSLEDFASGVGDFATQALDSVAGAYGDFVKQQSNQQQRFYSGLNTGRSYAKAPVGNSAIGSHGGTNWLLIGGAVVAGALLVKGLK